MMDAGRRLDALIAEKVMGWYSVTYHEQTNSAYGSPFKTTSERTYCPRYSEELEAAWEVLEKFNRDGLVVSVGSKRYIDSRELVWYALVGMAKPVDEFDMNANIYGEAEAPTAPLAICRAALKAVEHPACRK